MELTYASRWNRKERRVEGILEPDEARRRHAEGEPFCILVDLRGRPQAFIEVAAPEITVGRLDEQGRSTLEWGLERCPGHLFLHRATVHHRDGTRPTTQTRHVFDEDDHPPASHWSPLPAFEDLPTLIERGPELPAPVES